MYPCDCGSPTGEWPKDLVAGRVPKMRREDPWASLEKLAGELSGRTCVFGRVVTRDSPFRLAMPSLAFLCRMPCQSTLQFLGKRLALLHMSQVPKKQIDPT